MDNNGTYKGALAMITDITERKLLEQKLILKQLERQKNISRAEIIAQEDTNAHRPDIGLKNIKNSANIYDGTAEIISSPGNGCNMKIIFKECK